MLNYPKAVRNENTECGRELVWSRSRAERFSAGGGGDAETCGAELRSATDEKVRRMFILFSTSSYS